MILKVKHTRKSHARTTQQIRMCTWKMFIHHARSHCHIPNCLHAECECANVWAFAVEYTRMPDRACIRRKNWYTQIYCFGLAIEPIMIVTEYILSVSHAWSHRNWSCVYVSTTHDYIVLKRSHIYYAFIYFLFLHATRMPSWAYISSKLDCVMYNFCLVMVRLMLMGFPMWAISSGRTPNNFCHII